MKLLLIRHAEPDYTIDGLTPKGKVEAALLAERLKRIRIDDCYVSPKGRAQRTADAYLNLTGRTAETLEWLAEYRGRARNPETGDYRICWDYPPKVWESRPQLWNVETWAEDDLFGCDEVSQIWQETRDGVDALLAGYGYQKDGIIWRNDHNADQTVACFCHFGIAMAILGYLTGVSPMVLWHHFVMAPSSVTEIVTEERVKGEISWRCAKLGDITHLEGADEPWSTAGMFPEVYTGVDSTAPEKNGTLVPLARIGKSV